MAIIAALAALIVGAIILARGMARDTALRSDAKTIKVAVEAYYSRNKISQPPTQ